MFIAHGKINHVQPTWSQKSIRFKLFSKINLLVSNRIKNFDRSKERASVVTTACVDLKLISTTFWANCSKKLTWFKIGTGLATLWKICKKRLVTLTPFRTKRRRRAYSVCSAWACTPPTRPCSCRSTPRIRRWRARCDRRGRKSFQTVGRLLKWGKKIKIKKSNKWIGTKGH